MEEMHLVDSLLLISGQLQDVHGYTHGVITEEYEFDAMVRTYSVTLL